MSSRDEEQPGLLSGVTGLVGGVLGTSKHIELVIKCLWSWLTLFVQRASRWRVQSLYASILRLEEHTSDNIYNTTSTIGGVVQNVGEGAGEAPKTTTTGLGDATSTPTYNKVSLSNGRRC